MQQLMGPQVGLRLLVYKLMYLQTKPKEPKEQISCTSVNVASVHSSCFRYVTFCLKMLIFVPDLTCKIISNSFISKCPEFYILK